MSSSSVTACLVGQTVLDAHAHEAWSRSDRVLRKCAVPSPYKRPSEPVRESRVARGCRFDSRRLGLLDRSVEQKAGLGEHRRDLPCDRFSLEPGGGPCVAMQPVPVDVLRTGEASGLDSARLSWLQRAVGIALWRGDEGV